MPAAIGLATMLLAGCEKDPHVGTPLGRHVLLLTVDTLRPDYLSANGYELPTSPFIDSLLSSGANFANALTPIPRTTQALASLLTGCYPHTTGVRRLTDAMSQELVSVAQLAKNKGFHTIAVVSNHLLVEDRKLDRGFDVYDYAGDERDAQQTTRTALQYLRSVMPGESVFLWVHYIDPHVPYFPPQDLARQFDPQYRGRYRDHFGAVRGGIGNRAYPADLPKRRAVFQNDLPDEVNAHIRRLYAADVRYTDNSIADLVTGIRGQLGDNWLIIFTSDHGESLGEHDFFYDHGDYVYNATLKVPLAFIFPKDESLQGPRKIPDAVSLIDVMPTLIELLNLDLPTNLPYAIEGRSLTPYMRGEKLPPRVYFAECGRSYFSKMIRRRATFDVAGRFRSALAENWKLIWTPGQEPPMEYELYNVANDPNETVNLYTSDHPEAAKLKLLLHEWTRPTETTDTPLKEKDIELLRSLGYIE
jgi:arylsulfatase A-like enzyme